MAPTTTKPTTWQLVKRILKRYGINYLPLVLILGGWIFSQICHLKEDFNTTQMTIAVSLSFLVLGIGMWTMSTPWQDVRQNKIARIVQVILSLPVMLGGLLLSTAMMKNSNEMGELFFFAIPATFALFCTACLCRLSWPVEAESARKWERWKRLPAPVHKIAISMLLCTILSGLLVVSTMLDFDLGNLFPATEPALVESDRVLCFNSESPKEDDIKQATMNLSPTCQQAVTSLQQVTKERPNAYRVENASKLDASHTTSGSIKLWSDNPARERGQTVRRSVTIAYDRSTQNKTEQDHFSPPLVVEPLPCQFAFLPVEVADMVDALRKQGYKVYVFNNFKELDERDSTRAIRLGKPQLVSQRQQLWQMEFVEIWYDGCRFEK